MLLAAKADVSAKDNSGGTPLLWASLQGNKDLAELLLANQADVNAKDNSGQTPLQGAIQMEHKDVAELLRLHGGL